MLQEDEVLYADVAAAEVISMSYVDAGMIKQHTTKLVTRVVLSSNADGWCV